ncbi:hypothetical protein GCM10009554_07270 [Kribbella koreensis]|uniref:Uncharacterized protein n=2 Tax=Kribbella TaxID=182639 RepID=A0ABP6XK12_9ACTN
MGRQRRAAEDGDAAEKGGNCEPGESTGEGGPHGRGLSGSELSLGVGGSLAIWHYTPQNQSVTELSQ